MGGVSEATCRAPAKCLLVSLSSFSARQRVISTVSLLFLKQPSPTTRGKPTPALSLRQVCLQANVTPSTRIVCYVSFGSCVPWWLKILATTRRPRSSRTSFTKAQPEVGPRASWVGFAPNELRTIAASGHVNSTVVRGALLGLMLLLPA